MLCKIKKMIHRPTHKGRELSDEELDNVLGGMGSESFELWKIKVLNDTGKRDEVGSKKS